MFSRWLRWAAGDSWQLFEMLCNVYRLLMNFKRFKSTSVGFDEILRVVIIARVVSIDQLFSHLDIFICNSVSDYRESVINLNARWPLRHEKSSSLWKLRCSIWLPSIGQKAARCPSSTRSNVSIYSNFQHFSTRAWYGKLPKSRSWGLFNQQLLINWRKRLLKAISWHLADVTMKVTMQLRSIESTSSQINSER